MIDQLGLRSFDGFYDNQNNLPGLVDQDDKALEDFYHLMERLKKKNIAYSCNWIIYDKYLFSHTNQYSPITVFLSLQSPESLKSFVQDLLPTLKDSFILVIGGDVALINKDINNAGSNSESIQKLKENPYLKAVYVEGLECEENKFFHLPSGISVTKQSYNPLKRVNFLQRKFQVLWVNDTDNQTTKKISQYIKNSWKSCATFKNKMSRSATKEMLKNYTFCLVEGKNEQDKVWQALSMGCIPIVKRSSLEATYKRLPVVIVDKYDKYTLSNQNLKKYYEQQSHLFENFAIRSQVIKKLDAEHWWEKIKSRVERAGRKDNSWWTF